MYRGINLSVPYGYFARFDSHGRPGHQAHKNHVASVLETFKASDGSIIASSLVADWFPQLDCEVFISHAHQDSDLAIGFAGFLKRQFNIESFIDSCVWGYSDHLQKMIDDKYCWQNRSETYNYIKRNRSTAHVHMMLSTALTQMLNGCELVVFLNTPASISASDYISGSTTEAPWIYAELAMTTLIQRRSRDEHRPMRKAIAADEALRIRYPANLEHLAPMGTRELLTWNKRARGLAQFEALDVLYELVPDGS